jgi:hypothetical protein
MAASTVKTLLRPDAILPDCAVALPIHRFVHVAESQVAVIVIMYDPPGVSGGR